MKSGPTLKPATARPRAANAAIRPVATVVLPTPEWVPATTSLAVTRAPPPPRSPLDALLAADALVERVLDLAHLGDQVGGPEQLGGSIPAGDDHVLEPWPVAQHVDHLGDVQPAKRHRIGEFVEDQQVEGLVRDAALDLVPAFAGQVGGLLEVAGHPGPAVAHALPGDVAELLGRLPLANAPLAGLDELVDADPVAACPAAQHDAEGGGRLPLAVPRVDDQQRVVPPGPRHPLARRRRGRALTAHATRRPRPPVAPVAPGRPSAVAPVTARTTPASGLAASAS